MGSKRNKFKDRIANSEKFTFTLDFQFEVLRFLVQSKDSMLIVNKVKPGYFALIEHAIIMEVIRKFVRKYSKIPSLPLMNESLQNLLTSKEYVSLITKEDIPKIQSLIKNLYSNPLKDEEVIEENIHKFIAYTEMKLLNESMDFSDFNRYDEYQSRITKIIQNSKPKKDEEPLFMVEDTFRRQLMRKINPDVIPTPYWQLNQLSNGDGYTSGSIFVILDKPKARKTFALINIARGYLSMKKNVLYIDTENGKNQIMERMVQSTLNKTKREILSNEYDKLEQRHMRKYRRLGVEFIVERVPALLGDTNTIRNIIQEVESRIGKKIHVLVIDYAGKLAATTRDKEDVSRLNQVYVDLDNLAVDLGLDAIWTAQHVKREAAKHRVTRYEDNDIAGAISIVRNAQCILGLNSTPEEEAHGIQRLEVVVQRDGVPYGRCLFNIDPDRQRWKEFSKDARNKYNETQGKVVDQLINKDAKSKKEEEEDPRANNKHGDI